MTAPSLQPRRSLIFAPGNKPEMFPKALATGADIVCIDMEDAIAPAHKDEARVKTLALFETPQADDGVERVVRINCLRTADGMRDALALTETRTPPPAIMLPKVKTADEVRLLDDMLSDGPAAGVRFHVIIESNDGLNAAYDIAQSCGRIDALLFGGVDMAAELRAETNWDSLLYARARVAHAAAGAEIDLIDVPYLDLNDMDGMVREAKSAAALGFTGKGAIHPKQIAVLNECFSPSAEEIDQARRIIRAFEESDSGLVVIDGKLIEKPVLRSMYRVVAIAERIGATASA